MMSCSQEEAPTDQEHPVDIEAILAKAEFDKDRVHLPSRLEDAGTNLRKLADVYREAVRLTYPEIRQEADRRMMAIALPQAEAATWAGTPRRLKRKVPEESETWQRLDAIERTLQRNGPH